jgi:hypothetical protein
MVRYSEAAGLMRGLTIRLMDSTGHEQHAQWRRSPLGWRSWEQRTERVDALGFPRFESSAARV